MSKISMIKHNNALISVKYFFCFRSYKQRVAGSIPAAPTTMHSFSIFRPRSNRGRFLFSINTPMHRENRTSCPAPFKTGFYTRWQASRSR